MADLFLEQTKDFEKNLGFSQKSSRIFTKNSTFCEKLKVMEATCLRMPPKNWAKNKPEIQY